MPATVQVGQTSDIRAQVLDALGNPVAVGTRVDFFTTLGVLEPATTGTDSEGMATAVLTSTVTGTAVVTAQVGTVTDVTSVFFLPGPAGRVSLTADPEAIPVDGATSRILVTVMDRFGNPVSDEITVTFDTSLGTVHPQTAIATVGQAATTLTSGPIHGTAVVTATAASHIGTTTVQFQPADLRIDNENDPRGEILPGTEMTYTVKFSNRGQAVARRVIITDTLPVGFIDPAFEWHGATITPVQGLRPGFQPGGSLGSAPSGLEASPRAASGSEGIAYAWQVEDLSPDEGGTIIIRGRFDPNRQWPGSQFVTNKAEIRSQTAEGNPADNSQAAGNVIITADLYVQKAIDYLTSRLVPGGEIRYEISFGNLGWAPAQGLIITDTLPIYTSFWRESLDTSGLTRVSADSDPVQVWHLDALIRGANAGNFVLWLTIAEDAPGGIDLTNRIEIATATPEGDYTNNHRSVSTQLSGLNLVAGLKGPATVVPGRLVTYTLTYANTGTETAPSSVLTDTLPAGVSFVRASSQPATMTGRQVAWQLGDLLPGEVGNIVLVSRVATDVRASQVLTNAIELYTLASESFVSDNTARWFTKVVPDAPHTLVIEAGQTAVEVGGVAVPITATVTDQFQNRITGLLVTFTTTAGIITPTITTTVDGIATTTLKSGTVAGRATVAAHAGDLFDSTVVDFRPGTAMDLDLRANPDSIPADGQSHSTIHVLVWDRYGNRVIDSTPVTFETNLGRLYNGKTRHTVGTIDGLASTTLWAGRQPGVAAVQATVDAISAVVNVEFTEVPMRRVYLPLLGRNVR